MKRLFSVLIPALLLTGCGRESASVGIIGGADGPTAILVAGPELSVGTLVGLAACVLCAAGAVIFGIVWKKRNRK